MSIENGLVIKNLTKTFQTKEGEVEAVKDFNLEVKKGEFICLLGPSGCGKTTILRMLAGFEIPSSGEIYMGSPDDAKSNVAFLTPDKRDTAMVFQNYALFPHKNVYDNIAYGLKLKRLPSAQVQRRVDKMLGQMKMDDFAKRWPGQMSGGQQQRVALARALIMESSVLLFDEPLSNLDAKLRLHMREEIKQLQNQLKVTSVYVTHDQAEAMFLADRIVILYDGMIQQIGSPEEVYQKPLSEFVAKFIGRANILEGKILNSEKGGYTVEIHGKEFFVNEDRKFGTGDSVKLVARPESISLSDTVDDRSFTGKVTKSIFMGENYEYNIDFVGQILEVSENNSLYARSYNVGEKIIFQFNPRVMHIVI